LSRKAQTSHPDQFFLYYPEGNLEIKKRSILSKDIDKNFCANIIVDLKKEKEDNRFVLVSLTEHSYQNFIDAVANKSSRPNIYQRYNHNTVFDNSVLRFAVYLSCYCCLHNYKNPNFNFNLGGSPESFSLWAYTCHLCKASSFLIVPTKQSDKCFWYTPESKILKYKGEGSFDPSGSPNLFELAIALEFALKSASNSLKATRE